MDKKFYQLSPQGRIRAMDLSEDEQAEFFLDQSADNALLIENYVTDFRVPLGIVRNFLLDGKEYQLPLATEEPSVVAAANNGNRMLAKQGGIKAIVPEQAYTTGQLLFAGVDFAELEAFVAEHEEEIFAKAKAARPSIYRRGGGLLKVSARDLRVGTASVDFAIDTQAAMGANIVNTILEAEKEVFEPFAKEIVTAILSNSGLGQLVTVTGEVAYSDLGSRKKAHKMAKLSAIGQLDPERAVTENKGIYNGVAGVALATGNDWRALEAAGHAYASSSGQYRSLSSWVTDDDAKVLRGTLTLPVNVGTVGGSISAMPQARRSLQLLKQPSVDELRALIAGVGLAQNLAALKALAGEGIQRGHMRMQYRALAVSVGAREDELAAMVKGLKKAEQVDSELAAKLLKEIRINAEED
ncbi:hydroxymethylglutaryl-CoA reductase, degradative [Eupransor demetentiae]|uniref:3-hydroxy-3-methylglutaryl coenzyme A reductase n=1 Tax=Eupransor demetentiae TaxID=3109584 RepID=A0ABP0EQQ7_9LACO|nr:Hydroxymethylglutaryl-CoA reductase (HMG1) [Lactobacillaceae bacterium LMG 33000]